MKSLAANRKLFNLNFFLKHDLLKKQTRNKALSSVASLVLCLVIWQILAQFKVNLAIINFNHMPTPIEVGEAMLRFFQLPVALLHLKASVMRVFIGFFLAAIVGVAFGILIGRYKALAPYLLTPLEMLRPIPAVAWIPLAILLFPSSEVSMVYITFIGALFPILLNTIHGVEAVDPRLIASAKSLGARECATFVDVIIPSALPSIITGLSIGMGTCWFCLVTAEMISGQLGIGYFIWESFTLQNYGNIVVGMLLIGILGTCSSLLIRSLGHIFTPWYRLKRSS